MERENFVSPPLRSFGLAFDVLNGAVKFLLELFSAVSDPGKIGACPCRLLGIFFLNTEIMETYVE